MYGEPTEEILPKMSKGPVIIGNCNLQCRDLVAFEKVRLQEWWAESLNRITSKENVQKIMKFSKYQKLLRMLLLLKEITDIGLRKSSLKLDKLWDIN